MLRKLKPHLPAIAFAALGVLLALATADRLNPPDMARYQTLSPEVVARDGTLLRPFLSKDGYWRLKTKVSDVDPRYLTLLKAYEDKRFDEHFGVDPLALARATFQLVTTGHIVSGASTLTMQAARLLEPGRPRTVLTKLIQMARAIQLEERYSKKQILSIYLTLAPFGGNLEGVRAASLAYFGKEPNALDLSQAATLVALPQSPEHQRPDRHAIRAKAGRDKILTRMVADGVITKGDAQVAMRAGVASQRLAMPMIAPRLARRLARMHKGARIVTTIDAPLQTALERMAAHEQSYFRDGGSLAIVVADNTTHAVLAYVGGTNYWGPSGQIDLAARARSPGSALKPFIYGMAFDELILHPKSMMEDAPTNFGDYAPRDFSGGFQGAVTATDALRESLNIPAVMVLDRVGPLAFTLNLTNAGAHLAFPTRDEGPTLPVALGGLGISLADITMLYTGIADGGVVRPLRYLKDAPQGAPYRLFGKPAAYYLREILDGVSLPDGWAMGQGLARGRAIGFKTGTSYGFRDAWSVGFSNDYTVGIWVGRADGAPRADHVGRQTAAPILLKTFGLLPLDRKPPPPVPAGTILARSTAELPAGLRIFTRHAAPRPRVAEAHVPPPHIAFPPNGATVPLPAASCEGQADSTESRRRQGAAHLARQWRLLGSYTRFEPVLLTPPGAGFARITVVDAIGRSATAKVRFKNLP